MLKNKHLTLYVTGSIAAYKALQLTRLLVQHQAQVRVVLTAAAQKFITPLSFQTLSKHSVFTDTFASGNPHTVEHIELADWTELAVIAPASADIIAKLAHGQADDLASLALMATTAPKLIAPAMNSHMWNNPAVQRNVAQLKQDGYAFVDPQEGFLAEGYTGKGRMAEPAQIAALVDAHFIKPSPSLQNQPILVTAGGTRERLDPVRFLANDSSGKMGYALAQVLQQRGAQVTLISAPTKLQPPAQVHLIPVTTTEEMATAVKQQFPHMRALIMAAAVADFRPPQVAAQKIKKQPDQTTWQLPLIKTVDILQMVAHLKQPHQITIGFAAETSELIEQATAKLRRKHLDLIVANNVAQPGVGFNSDTNQVTFISPHQPPKSTQLLSKTAIAALVIDQLEMLLQS